MKVVEQFKRRILDLAIRGKLVPQDPNDEPASILLERIKAEKAKLVKAGKIKKEKNPSEIVVGSDGAAYEKFGSGDLSHAEARRRGVDVPFELPQGWAWCKISDVFSVERGGSPRPIKDYLTDSADGINWIKIADASASGKYITTVREKIRPQGLKKTRRVFVGDLLLTNSMSFGHPYILQVDGCIHDGWLVLHAFDSQLDKEFFYHLLSSRFVYVSFSITASGGVVQNLNAAKVSDTSIPLPPLAEQKRIVAYIEKLFRVADSLGEAADGLENAAKRLDKKILDLAIRGRLVPQDPNDEPASELVKRIAASHKSPCKNQSEPIDQPFEIPDSWEWVRLGTITNYGQCKSIGAKSILPDTWLLDLEEIEKDTGRLLARRTAAEKKSSSSKHVFCRGMVLYSKLRTYLNKVLVADMDGVCTSEIVPISVVDGVCPEYLCLALTSQYFLQYTASRGYGVKMPRVGTNDMRSALIPLPPLNEQKRIVKRVEALKATTRTLVTF